MSVIRRPFLLEFIEIQEANLTALNAISPYLWFVIADGHYTLLEGLTLEDAHILTSSGVGHYFVYRADKMNDPDNMPVLGDVIGELCSCTLEGDMTHYVQDKSPYSEVF